MPGDSQRMLGGSCCSCTPEQKPLLAGSAFAGAHRGPEIIGSNLHDGGTTQECPSFAIRPHAQKNKSSNHYTVQALKAIALLPGLQAGLLEETRLASHRQFQAHPNSASLRTSRSSRSSSIKGSPQQKNILQLSGPPQERVPAPLGPAVFRGPGRWCPWPPVAPHSEHGTAAHVCAPQSLETVLSTSSAGSSSHQGQQTHPRGAWLPQATALFSGTGVLMESQTGHPRAKRRAGSSSQTGRPPSNSQSLSRQDQPPTAGCASSEKDT